MNTKDSQRMVLGVDNELDTQRAIFNHPALFLHAGPLAPIGNTSRRQTDALCKNTMGMGWMVGEVGAVDGRTIHHRPQNP